MPVYGAPSQETRIVWSQLLDAAEHIEFAMRCVIGIDFRMRAIGKQKGYVGYFFPLVVVIIYNILLCAYRACSFYFPNLTESPGIISKLLSILSCITLILMSPYPFPFPSSPNPFYALWFFLFLVCLYIDQRARWFPYPTRQRAANCKACGGQRQLGLFLTFLFDACYGYVSFWQIQSKP